MLGGLHEALLDRADEAEVQQALRFGARGLRALVSWLELDERGGAAANGWCNGRAASRRACIGRKPRRSRPPASSAGERVRGRLAHHRAGRQRAVPHRMDLHNGSLSATRMTRAGSSAWRCSAAGGWRWALVPCLRDSDAARGRSSRASGRVAFVRAARCAAPPPRTVRAALADRPTDT
jgi:hypothetical protein